jgi:hypothetical protein
LIGAGAVARQIAVGIVAERRFGRTARRAGRAVAVEPVRCVGPVRGVMAGPGVSVVVAGRAGELPGPEWAIRVQKLVAVPALLGSDISGCPRFLLATVIRFSGWVGSFYFSYRFAVMYPHAVQ